MCIQRKTQGKNGESGNERDEVVDGYCEKSDPADPVQLHSGDAASDVSGTLLAALREGGTWRLGLYPGIFLWHGRLRNRGLEALCILDGEGEEGRTEKAPFLQPARVEKVE